LDDDKICPAVIFSIHAPFKGGTKDWLMPKNLQVDACKILADAIIFASSTHTRHRIDLSPLDNAKILTRDPRQFRSDK
jgi:hypothetical protein